MRISALTMTARIKPCARAIPRSPAELFVSLAIIIAAPPTNTSANVPMNSATKWRQESRIGEAPPLIVITAPCGASVHATKDEGCVDSTEAERIGQNMLDPLFFASARQKVKITGFVGNGEVDRWRQPFALDRERRDCGFDRTRGAE